MTRFLFALCLVFQMAFLGCGPEATTYESPPEEDPAARHRI
jgi:hypothetical protein